MKRMNVLSNLLEIMNNRKGLLILCLSLATFGVESAWGANDYYAKITPHKSGTGSGTVYVSNSDNCHTSTKGGIVTIELSVKDIASNSEFIGWALSEDQSEIIQGSNKPTYTATVNASNSKKEANAKIYDYYGFIMLKPIYYFKTKAIPNNDQYGIVYAGFIENPTQSYAETHVTTSVSETFATKNVYYKAIAKEGYIFDGWYSDPNYKNQLSTSSTHTTILQSSSVNAKEPETQIVYARFLSKVPLNIEANMPSNIFVDEKYENAFLFNHAYKPEPSIKVISINPINNGDEQVIEYDATNNRVIAHNAGTARITFTQEETDTILAGSQSFDITVNKHVPTFTWSNATLYHNQTYSDFFTTNCSNDLTVKSSSDDNVAYLENGSNAQKLNLKTLTKAASTTLTVTQAENYYWAEHTESKTVTPIVAPNHVPFTYNEAMFNDGNITITKAGDCSWQSNGYVRLGGSNTEILPGRPCYDYDDKYIILKFNGIPHQLSFEISTNTNSASGADWYIQQSSDGSSWGDVWSVTRNSKDWSSTYTKDLDKESRYLKFCYSGNFAGDFRNITVTELETFSTSVNKLDFGNDNKVGVTCESQTFKFNYANVGHKVTLSTNDSRFTVSPSSITSIGGEQYGDTTITVTYNTDAVHTASGAKLTISDELNHSKEITLSGSTTKKTQTIEWVNPYKEPTIPVIPINKVITGAAKASSQLEVTYTSSDSTIIKIVDNGKAFKAVAEGSATITAKQIGTGDWEADSISKTFMGTYKIIQVISWNQNFTRLLTTYGAQDLTAKVNLEDAQTGVQTWSKERSDLITYTSQNNSVVSVNGSTLTIVGAGTTTLTASVPGDELYESATVTIPITVRVPSDGCEDVLLGNNFGSDEYEFFHWSVTSDMEKVVAIDRTTSAIPGQLSFQHKGKKWGLNYSGAIDIYESTNNGSSWNKLGSVTPTEGSYNTQTYPLSRNATHVKFFRGKSATGYHYIKNVEISPAQFIESNVANDEIDFGTVTVNSVEDKSVILSYANVKDNLAITKSSSDLSLTCGDIIDLDCGATGTNTFTVTFTPSAVGDFSDAIQFNDKNGKKNYTLNIKAKVVRSTQHITWEPAQTEYRTIDQIVLNATSSSSYPVKYYVKEGTDVADFVNGVLTIKKDGKITIRAYEPGDALWAPAVDVDKTFTIRKTNLHFDPLPSAAAITYPQTLSESALTDGVIKDEEGNVVEGTITWTTPTTQLNAGENQSQGITFTPSTNPAWYSSLTSTVSVTVQKAQPDATAHAGNITYGQKVNESVLSNSGTDGTWTWAEDEKEKVLEVGTHEGLKVHFTPTDQTNYNEIDGTVSLTVNRATPSLTWTAKPETAQVHETKTFTASSTNTDNTAVITYSIIFGGDCASINATTGEVTMTKAGTITIKASQAETTNYNAVNIETTCTISVAPTIITTAPTTDNIVSGTNSNEVVLTGGEAQNTINNQTVEGTFTVTAGDLVNVGEQTLTVTFTPNNTDMYDGCTTTITANVVQREATAEEIGTPSAAAIVYGNAVNTSALSCNGGTLSGTWTWTDERKDDILNAGTYDDLQVHFVPENKNYNEADATVSLTVNKAVATLNWETAPTEANVQEHVTYTATSNHTESVITYSIIAGDDCATIDANTGALTITKAGTITVQASQAASTNYEEATAITISTTLTGEFENKFSGDGYWNDADNWTNGIPTGENPNVVISGNMTIDESISVGGLTIEEGGSVTIIVKGDLTVNGTSKERDAYGDLFVHNGGNVTIGSEANVKVHDFVIESSIGTQDGTSQSGQVDNGDNVIYTNGAYIDINMDPRGNVDPAQWYGFTVPFQVDAKNGVSRKEGDIFRPCTYGVDYMIAEYDMNQRLSTGKGWKFISDYTLQAGHFYYLTIDGTYNTYRFKAKNNTITIEKQTTLKTNGTGANANWNAVGNTTLTYATISGDDLPQFVQTYINGQSCYQVVYTQDVQFVVGCPFFFQATKNNTTMVLSKPTGTTSAHYAPRQTDRPICVRIAEEGKRFSDQMYITASEDAQGQYQMGRDLAKAGVGTKSAQLWINAYNQQLCVNDAPLVANQAFYDMSLFIPKAGNYEISLPTTPTNGTLYLTQDGYPIWNLNDAPYVLESGKGTISEYGLMFEATQAAAPTDVQTINGNDNAQKILKEQSIYIYKNGNIFNVTGQKVK